MTANTIYLDLTGLKCPLPVLRARRALLRLKAGQTLQVRCNDPMAAIDIPAMVQQAGDYLLRVDRSAENLFFEIAPVVVTAR